MITSVFGKSRPINYIALTVVLVLSFFLYLFSNQLLASNFAGIIYQISQLILIGVSLFLIDFIVKKNGMSKDHSFTFFFCLLWLLFFPSVFERPDIIAANFFILLAMRRLISLQSLIVPKEKIFDASFWVFVAALFHFWSILFIVVVFISIIFHVSGDYRNWLLPFIAFFTVLILFVFFSLLLNKDWIDYLLNQTTTDFTFTYFQSKAESAVWVIYLIFSISFLMYLLVRIRKTTINYQSAYKKIAFAFLLSLGVFSFSPEKSNAILAYSFLPVSVFATHFVEKVRDKWFREVIVTVLTVTALLFFLIRL